MLQIPNAELFAGPAWVVGIGTGIWLTSKAVLAFRNGNGNGADVKAAEFRVEQRERGRRMEQLLKEQTRASELTAQVLAKLSDNSTRVVDQVEAIHRKVVG